MALMGDMAMLWRTLTLVLLSLAVPGAASAGTCSDNLAVWPGSGTTVPSAPAIMMLTSSGWFGEPPSDVAFEVDGQRVSHQLEELGSNRHGEHLVQVRPTAVLEGEELTLFLDGVERSSWSLTDAQPLLPEWHNGLPRAPSSIPLDVVIPRPSIDRASAVLETGEEVFLFVANGGQQLRRLVLCPTSTVLSMRHDITISVWLQNLAGERSEVREVVVPGEEGPWKDPPQAGRRTTWLVGAVVAGLSVAIGVLPGVARSLSRAS